jgi:hypothetical protein
MHSILCPQKRRTAPTTQETGTIPQKKKKQEETGTIDAQQIYTDGNISGDISNNEI